MRSIVASGRALCKAGRAGGLRGWMLGGIVASLLACAGPHPDAASQRAPDAIAANGAGVAPGPAARELLAAPGFDWHTTESTHLRVHTPAGSYVDAHVKALADSTELARAAALQLLGEPTDHAGEPKAELFFVDTREDMQRLVRMPIGGFAQPGELTAVFVAGDGYKPFLRHELTHAYAAVRWGKLEAGDWLTEGLGALAQGDCQGHTVDAIAAGYARKDSIPPLRTLAGDFRSFPELPSYIGAASAVDFVRRRSGIGAIRTLWQTPRTNGHPLGTNGDSTEAEWRRHLAGVAPATLDVPSLRRAGC